MVVGGVGGHVEDFPRIQKPLRIEDLFDHPHKVNLVLALLSEEVLPLADAYTVFLHTL